MYIILDPGFFYLESRKDMLDHSIITNKIPSPLIQDLIWYVSTERLSWESFFHAVFDRKNY